MSITSIRSHWDHSIKVLLPLSELVHSFWLVKMFYRYWPMMVGSNGQTISTCTICMLNICTMPFKEKAIKLRVQLFKTLPEIHESKLKLYLLKNDKKWVQHSTFQLGNSQIFCPEAQCLLIHLIQIVVLGERDGTFKSELLIRRPTGGPFQVSICHHGIYEI